MALRTAAGIGQRIAELRDENAISQRQLGETVGLDQSVVSRIERGERGLAVGELTTLAEAFGVEVESILRDDEPAFAFRSDASDEDLEKAKLTARALAADFFSARALVGVR